MIAHLPRFARDLERRGYRRNTARSYRSAIRRFVRWQRGEPPTAASVEAYRNDLHARTCRATVRGHCAALSLFFAFLVREGLAEALPPVPAPLPPDLNRQGKRSGGRLP